MDGGKKVWAVTDRFMISNERNEQARVGNSDEAGD